MAADTVAAVEVVVPECILAPDNTNDTSSHRTNAVTLFYVAQLLAPVLLLRWDPTLATYFTAEYPWIFPQRRQREGVKEKAPEVMASVIDCIYYQGRRYTMLVQLAQYPWTVPTQRGNPA